MRLISAGRLSVGMIVFASSSLAHAQEFKGDPAGSGVIVGAVHWLQGTLLGTVATVAAVIAVAVVGFMMLTGRINWRYSATVILGCFILLALRALSRVFSLQPRWAGDK